MSDVYAPWGDWQQYPDRPCAGRTGKWEEQRNIREPRRASTSAASIRVSIARQECARCPVLTDCAAWALTTPDPCEGMVAGGMTTRQRAAVRDEQPRRKRPTVKIDIHPRLEPRSIPHGTTGGYSNYQCRCDACRQAMREYDRKRRSVA